MNEWEKRATDFILGIILHLKTVNQINIISFCLGKRDTGSGLQNFSFEIISLCLGKHIGRSLTEFTTLYSFKLALNLYIITLSCRGKAEFVRNHE